MQLYHPNRDLYSLNYALKLVLKETFPVGNYQNLSPKNRLTDVGGGGSWQTAVGLVLGFLSYLGKNHFLTSRTSFQYNLPAPVSVKNLNAYGGAKGTRGTVYPAQSLQAITSLEVNMTQNWAFAVDFQGVWTGKTRFKGRASAPNTAPSSVQFSMAPAIEYNWSANMGMIFGPWFTFAGRNAVQFCTAVFAFNYYN